MAKNFKIWMVFKMPSFVILLKNQLIFIGQAMKICTLGGKRLLITRMITLLIKNKIYSFYIS